VVYGTATRRMAMRPGYSQDASADNATVFHGREVRKAGSLSVYLKNVSIGFRV